MLNYKYNIDVKTHQGKYSSRNIVLHELIGLDVKILNCSDRHQIGICGTVINETKNMLIISTEKGIRKVSKNTCVFEFKINDKRFIVDGNEISYRSHERTEKSIKFYQKRR